MKKPVLGQGWRKLLKRLAASPKGGRLVRLAGLALTTLISLYLLLRLTRIGWGRVWEAVPETPWFYLALAAKYFTYPLFQALIFRRIWKAPLRPLIAVLLNKRILDKNVLDMSGDVYLFNWARSHVSASPKDIVLALKDNLLVSSAVSVGVALGVVASFLGLGLVSLPETWLASQWRYAPLFLLAGLAAAALVIRFRKAVFFLDGKTLRRMLLLHLARTLAVQALQVGQWAVALPGVGLDRWLSLLAVNIVVSNIPFVPSRNLVFFGAGLEISGHLQLPQDELAGIFLAANVISQVLNLLVFLWASCEVRRKKKPEGAAGGPPLSRRTGPEASV